jgi:solute carrier family 25 (adenine nucleotide translocator) protein 4/5/6/31
MIMHPFLSWRVFQTIMGDENPRISSFVLDFVLGGAAGAFSKTLVAPIDRVKMILQTQDANQDIRSGLVRTYSGNPLSIASRILKEQGMLSFWRGNMANVLRYFPTQATNLALKDEIKKIFGPPKETQNRRAVLFLHQTISGSVAAACSLTAVYPLEFARTRLSADVRRAGSERKFKGILDCIVKTAKAQGVLAVYRGFVPSLFGIMVYRGIQFGLNDTLLVLYPEHTNVIGLQSFGVMYAYAQLSVFCAALVSYPFDTVRRRVQMDSDLPAAQRTYSGVVDCVRKTKGLKMFYKGFGVNLVRTIGSSLVLVLYQEFQTFFA